MVLSLELRFGRAFANPTRYYRVSAGVGDGAADTEASFEMFDRAEAQYKCSHSGGRGGGQRGPDNGREGCGWGIRGGLLSGEIRAWTNVQRCARGLVAAANGCLARVWCAAKAACMHALARWHKPRQGRAISEQ